MKIRINWCFYLKYSNTVFWTNVLSMCSYLRIESIFNDCCSDLSKICFIQQLTIFRMFLENYTWLKPQNIYFFLPMGSGVVLLHNANLFQINKFLIDFFAIKAIVMEKSFTYIYISKLYLRFCLNLMPLQIY